MNKPQKRLENNISDIKMSARLTLNIERFELDLEFNKLDDTAKIKNFVAKQEDKILLWYRRKRNSQEITDSTTWAEFKSLLLFRFGFKDAMSIVDVIKNEFKSEGNLREYVEEMETLGIEFDMEVKSRNEIIKDNFVRGIPGFSSSFIFMQEFDFTKDKDLKIIREIDRLRD